MSDKLRILIAEDDENIIELIRLYLENEGYEVCWAPDGEAAWSLFQKTHFDVAVLDVMMPKMNGYDLTKKIREKSGIPIIILSAAQLDSNKILGLNLGADDYMVKPFNPLELVARVNANARRAYKLTQSGGGDKLTVGDLVLDTHMLTLHKGGMPVNLTATEYKILAMMMKNPGRVYTKMQIYEEVNGDWFDGDDNTVMVHISNLRDKIEEDTKNPKYIKTVRGLGYRLEKI